jgi:hypothetical protein
MMLHIDVSTHGWLGLESGRQDLVTLMDDDAISEIYYDEECAATVIPRRAQRRPSNERASSVLVP